MPQRTTLFQRAVYYTKKHLADATTQEVTESKMLIDSATGEEREVDIVLGGSVGAYPVVISIECNEQGRRAGTPWVESMHTKHSTLPTDKLILVSQAGFSRPALTKAAYLGHVTVTPDEPTEETLHSVVREMKRLCIAAFDILIDSVYFDLPPQGDFPGTVVLCDDDYVVYRELGAPFARVAQLVETFKDGISESIIEKPVQQGWSHFQWTFQPESDESTQLYLKATSPTEMYLAVGRIFIVGRVLIEEQKIALTHGILEGVSHAYGQADIGGQSATAFVTAVGDDAAQVSVDISGKPTIVIESAATGED